MRGSKGVAGATAIGVLVAAIAGVASGVVNVHRRPVLWTDQIGGLGEDIAVATAVSRTSEVVVAGYTTGGMPGETASGSGQNAFVVKYDKNGNWVLTRSVATNNDDQFSAVAVASNGDFYAVGQTGGTLPTQATKGSYDAMLARWDKKGNLKFLIQFGTSAADNALGVAVNSSGDAFVVGTTWGTFDNEVVNPGQADAFIAKFDKNGVEKWHDQLGTDQIDAFRSVSLSTAGDAFVGGTTEGDLARTQVESSELLLARYTKNGARTWLQQFDAGAPAELTGVTVGANTDVYFSGVKHGANDDGLVGRFDKNGVSKWITAFGTGEADGAAAISAVKGGGVFVAGYTLGTFPGQPVSDTLDGFVARYDVNGLETWLRQVDASLDGDDASAVATLPNGTVVAAGNTEGSLWGHANAGLIDVWVSVFPAS